MIMGSRNANDSNANNVGLKHLDTSILPQGQPPNANTEGPRIYRSPLPLTETVLGQHCHHYLRMLFFAGFHLLTHLPIFRYVNTLN